MIFYLRFDIKLISLKNTEHSFLSPIFELYLLYHHLVKKSRNNGKSYNVFHNLLNDLVFS